MQARLELAGERVRVAGQRVQTRLGDAAERLAGADRFAGPPPLPEIARRDVLTYGQRCFLGLLIAVVMGVASGVLQDGGRRAGANIPCVIVAIVLGLLGLGVAWKYWQGGPETLGIRRLVIGLTLTVCVLVGGLIGGVDGPAIQAEGLTALAAPLLLCNWNTLLDRRRPRRLSLWPAVWMGIVGVTAIEFFADGRGSLLGMAIVAGLVLASQASMVWIPGRSTGVEYGVDLEPATIAVPPQRPAPAAAAYQPTPAPPPSGEPVRVSVAPPPLPGTTLAGPVSPYLRLPALLLNAVGVFGICGLHRFYVGKWLSGFIWLCTFGLMGIGQIYDLIMIITGGFTDDDERPLVAWQQLNEPGVRLAAARVGAHIAATNRTGRVIRVRRTSIPLAILGYAVLLPGLILGLACVVHIYDVVAGVADINRDMTRSFGYPDWPHLLERITVTVTLAVMGAATLLLATARARAGVAHVARGIVGIAGLAIAGTAFYDGLGQINWTVFWAAIEKTPGPALEMLFKSFDGETLIVGLVLSTAAMIVLLWPEKRQALNGSDTAGLEVQA